MSVLKAMVSTFVRDDDAATMVEYALMLALIAIVCITAVTLIGDNANAVFNGAASNLGSTT